MAQSGLMLLCRGPDLILLLHLVVVAGPAVLAEPVRLRLAVAVARVSVALVEAPLTRLVAQLVVIYRVVLFPLLLG